MKKIVIFGPRHPELILVDNGGLAAVIEGGQRSCNSEAYATPSDLSRSFISERFDARLHGAGINDEENAGQRDNAASAAFSVLVACSAAGGMGGACSLLDSRKPHAEKGMHTRSQQIFFGGGETRESETSLTFGEISEVRHPASFSL
jgi:hypothetical protein